MEFGKHIETKRPRLKIFLSPFSSRLESVLLTSKGDESVIDSYEELDLKENERLVLNVNRNGLVHKLEKNHDAEMIFDGQITDWYFELKDGDAVGRFGDWPRIRRAVDKDGKESFEFTIKGTDTKTEDRGYEQNEINMSANSFAEAVKKMEEHLNISIDSLYAWSKVTKERTTLRSTENENIVEISIDKFISSAVTAKNKAGEFITEEFDEQEPPAIPTIAEFEVLYPDPGDDKEKLAKMYALIEYRDRLMKKLYCEEAPEGVRNITTIQQYFNRETHMEIAERIASS